MFVLKSKYDALVASYENERLRARVSGRALAEKLDAFAALEKSALHYKCRAEEAEAKIARMTGGPRQNQRSAA